MSTLERRLALLEAPHEQASCRFYTDTERAAKLMWLLETKGPHYERLIAKFPQFARTDAQPVRGTA